MIRAADFPAVGYRTRNIRFADMIGSLQVQMTRGSNRNYGDWNHSMLGEDAPAASKQHKVSPVAEPVHLPRMGSLADVCSKSIKSCTSPSMLNMFYRSFTLQRWHTLKLLKSEWATSHSPFNVQNQSRCACCGVLERDPWRGSGAPLGISKFKRGRPSYSTCSLESFTSRSSETSTCTPVESPTPSKWHSVFKTLSKYAFVVIISNDHFTTVMALKTLPKKLSCF